MPDLRMPLIQFAKADARIGSFLGDLIDACVMECYFREHIAKHNLLAIIKQEGKV